MLTSNLIEGPRCTKNDSPSGVSTKTRGGAVLFRLHLIPLTKAAQLHQMKPHLNLVTEGCNHQSP